MFRTAQRSGPYTRCNLQLAGVYRFLLQLQLRPRVSDCPVATLVQDDAGTSTQQFSAGSEGSRQLVQSNQLTELSFTWWGLEHRTTSFSSLESSNICTGCARLDCDQWEDGSLTTELGQDAQWERLKYFTLSDPHQAFLSPNFNARGRSAPPPPLLE
jgi:hypothetical protein